jgi:hypothetical protein
MIVLYRKADNPRSDRAVSVEAHDPPDRLLFVDDAGWYRRVQVEPPRSAMVRYRARAVAGQELEDLVDSITGQVMADSDALLALRLSDQTAVRSVVATLMAMESVSGLLLVGFPIGGPR